ncbi:MAG: hypothetical protein QXE01_09525 [Sulfolobales archaeon]
MVIRDVGVRIAPILIISLVILSAIQAPHRQGLIQGGIQGVYWYSEEGSWVSQFTLRTGTYTYPNGTTVTYNYFDVSPFRVFALYMPDPRFSNFSIEASSDYISPPNSLELRYGSRTPEEFRLYLGLLSGSAPNLSNGIVYGASYYIKIADLYIDPEYRTPGNIVKTLRTFLSLCPLGSVAMNTTVCTVYSEIYISVKYNGSGYVVNILPPLINVKYEYEPYVDVRYVFGREYSTSMGSWLNLRLLMIYNASTGKTLVAVETDGNTIGAALLKPLDQRFLSILADPIAGIGFEMSNVVPYLAGNTTIRFDDFGLFYGKGWFSEEALLGYTQTTTEYYTTTTPTSQTWPPPPTWSPPQIYTVTVTERIYITVPTPVYITVTYPYYTPVAVLSPQPQPITMVTITATAAGARTEYITVEKRYTEALSTTTITISRLITQQIRSEGGITDTGLIIATAITAIAIITASMIRTRKKQ